MRIACLGLALAAGVGIATPADAASTLTGSYATWLAGIGAARVTNTAFTGLFDPFALNLPTTATIPLSDGQTLTLTNIAQVTEPQNGFPYTLSDGFAGDLLIPVDAGGNQLSSETILPSSSISAFGFEVAPFSSNLRGPYSITVALSNGQTLTQSATGGDFFPGSTTSDFFGYFGGPVSSLTITTSDPNGLGFGNFVDVPEPQSLLLMAAAMIGCSGLARRRR